jgi:hypothetical protein
MTRITASGFSHVQQQLPSVIGYIGKHQVTAAGFTISGALTIAAFVMRKHLTTGAFALPIAVSFAGAALIAAAVVSSRHTHKFREESPPDPIPQLAPIKPLLETKILVASSQKATIPQLIPSDRIVASQPIPIQDSPYMHLTCSRENCQKIAYLITTLGKSGKLTLLGKYRELRQIGDDIDPVHPLKMLSIILKDPELRLCLKAIYSDHFKWSNFIDGMKNKLSVLHQEDRVSIYIPDFAQDVGVKIDQLQKFIQSQQWEKMVIFLINHAT